MSSIKTLLENLDRIDQKNVVVEQLANPSTVNEILDFTNEWQEFKESYYLTDPKKTYIDLVVDGRIIAKFEANNEGYKKAIESLEDYIDQHSDSHAILSVNGKSILKDQVEQLDEVLPALAAAGGAIARGVAALGGAAARGATAAGKGLAQVGQQAVKGGAQLAGQAVAGMAKGLASGGGATTAQQQDNQEKQQNELTQQVKATATNLQALKSATGANINVPAATTSLSKAISGQPMSTIDSKNLSSVTGAFQQALTNPSTAKQLVDVVKRATAQK